MYWYWRWASRMQHDVLVIVIDSLDQTNLTWPTWNVGSTPHRTDHMHRPRTVMTAAIAHGWSISVFMADSRVSHGACAFIEIVRQTLDRVLQVARSRGLRFPSRLVIESDNTVAQANNATVMLLFGLCGCPWLLRLCGHHVVDGGPYA